MSKERKWNFDDLIHRVSTYMNSDHVKMVKRAYNFADHAHKNQLRKSGTKYIVHPLQVAGILAELKMDPETICAGLLHDVIKHAHVPIKDVKEQFGDNIALIVDGVTKISQMKYKSHNDRLAANYRKMLLSVSHDIRIIIVKLADCLDNMRTLKHLESKKRLRIANETLAIYAPLADRLGIGAIKWELEDLSLRYLDPEQYYLVAHLMHSKRTQRVAYINMAVHDVRKVISNLHIKVDVYGRPKHIYSIYRKMHNKHKKFSQIYDLLALRVITKSIKDCYAVLGAIQSKWKPVNGRFKDYIANPKPNMYQSLHTTVIGPEGKLLEAQIRTAKMHQIAEYGVAAHWAYKEGIKDKIKGSSDNYKLNEYKHVIELQEQDKNSDENEIDETLNSGRNALFDNHVYIFTPRGDVLELPKHSKPLDVAYKIHTEVGNHTTGVTVNGKMVPLDYELKTGDVVDILTSSNASPSRDWLGLVTSVKTKRKIKQYFRRNDRERNIVVGKEILNKKVKDDDYDPRIILTDDNINKIAQSMHYRDMDDLLAMIGFGDIQPEGIVKRLTKDVRENQEKEHRAIEQQQLLNQHHPIDPNRKSGHENKKNGSDVVIEGIDNLLIHLSHCCNPIPGDPIVGYITMGHGVAIHRKNCPNVKKFESTGQRIVNAHWADNSSNGVNYNTILKIRGYNRTGLLNDVLKKINAVTKQIKSVEGKVGNREVVSITIYLDLHNVQQYQALQSSLKNVNDIYSVKRAFQ
ncbi:GTP pyrophosphokinase [Philodulcilactobacillus myokoensis]|uniref:GTP diphosphokinase n=1 Tax=Philodulcilactobacillus myokoensis TaxID=2929573 RepID=A0A9W6ESM2_9LACO|nr:bifunctional (p)ppGpp synthetase/guanosine-3',5'-bis(diphosphate) 3'-pyrophosphohydrolase [Philodulcilactobacillus myokoensis]GLB46925.1 GTP pyrophosphokinase [Philodulcilactobacillus myokoensis]